MERTHQDNLGLSVIPPKKGGQAWCKSNSKPSQTTSQMTDPVTNPKQKAMVRDASQTSLWHQDSLQSRDNYFWEVFYHHTFPTNARRVQCLHHTHNTRDLWWCCCARADSPSLTLFKVLNSMKYVILIRKDRYYIVAFPLSLPFPSEQFIISPSLLSVVHAYMTIQPCLSVLFIIHLLHCVV